MSYEISLSTEKQEKDLGFSPELGWSHYRNLMNVENRNERLFYEIEAEKEGWEVKQLQRQIHSFLFARLLKSKDKKGVMELVEQGQKVESAVDLIKSPYIFDFLGLPDLNVIHETEFENAIIDVFSRDLMNSLAHLYIREEAIIIGVCANITSKDYAASTYWVIVN